MTNRHRAHGSFLRCTSHTSRTDHAVADPVRADTPSGEQAAYNYDEGR